MPNEVTGLLEDEQRVLIALITAWDKFVQLPQQHLEDNVDFMRSINRCQELLGMRVVRRLYPDGWTHTPGTLGNEDNLVSATMVCVICQKPAAIKPILSVGGVSPLCRACWDSIVQKKEQKENPRYE